MGCCSLKVLSLISAWIHVALGLLGFVICVGVLSFNFIEPENFDESLESDDKLNYLMGAFIFACVIFGISFIMNIFAIVAIHNAHAKLMSIYVYANTVMILVCVIAMIVQFYAQLSYKDPLGDAFISLLITFFLIGLEVLFFTPILMMFLTLRKGPILPEQHHSLRNNEPANKPMYGGQI